MRDELNRLKNLIDGIPVYHRCQTATAYKGDQMLFENNQAMERAKRTLQHFIKRGIVPGEQS